MQPRTRTPDGFVRQGQSPATAALTAPSAPTCVRWLLGRDPLADIRNVRKLALVMQGAVAVDHAALPLKPVSYKPIPKVRTR